MIQPIFKEKRRSLYCWAFKRQCTLLMSLILAVLIFYGCKRDRLDIDTEDITIDIEVKRFEQELFSIPEEQFSAHFDALYDEYTIFMHGEKDSILLLDLLHFTTDPKVVALYERSESIFADFSSIAGAIKDVYKHYKYYYPDASVPCFYTHISGLNRSLLEMPVILNDSVAIISLDMYLGSGFQPYQQLSLPRYKTRWMHHSQIAPEVARQLALNNADQKESSETLLDIMIFQGKLLYFLDAMMPHIHDTTKIKYTAKQLDWCNKHQKHSWAYLIENQILYTTDHHIIQRFIQDGPFTAVFTESAPPRIAQWFGWQIVRKYMNKHTNISLHALMMDPDSQKILKKSGYKPE
ncbi:MAG: hypothetical protein RQ866_01980 [Bacteroidales bacterium]|nr:hypothetical protein [Bacteroidales bacterium]